MRRLRKNIAPVERFEVAKHVEVQGHIQQTTQWGFYHFNVGNIIDYTIYAEWVNPGMDKPQHFFCVSSGIEIRFMELQEDIQDIEESESGERPVDRYKVDVHIHNTGNAPIDFGIAKRIGDPVDTRLSRIFIQTVAAFRDLIVTGMSAALLTRDSTMANSVVVMMNELPKIDEASMYYIFNRGKIDDMDPRDDHDSFPQYGVDVWY